MLIRAATLDDLDRLTELRLRFIADVRELDRATLEGEFAAATRAFLDSSMRAGRLLSWFAFDGDECLGVVAMILNLIPPRPTEPRGHEGYIINMFVTPAARGRGIARALMQTCIDHGPDHGIARFSLHATEAGRPLYEQLGFAASDEWLELVAPPSWR